MSENAAKQSAGTQGAAAPRGSTTVGSGTTHGVPEPHFASRSPKVLARVPDLESADSEVVDQTAPAGRDGRMLSSRLSMLILVGGGGLLLLAALGLPFLLQSPEPPDAASEEEMPTWPLEPPAPSASVAPAWNGGAEQESTWELPAGTPAQYPSDMPATSAWNDSPQMANWGEPFASGSWESSPAAQPWPSPPAEQAWENQPPAPVQDGPRVPAFPGSTAAGVPPADQSDWSPQVESTPEVDRESAASWQEGPRAPSWPMPPYGRAGQGQAPLAAPDGLIPSPSAAANPGQLAPTSELTRLPQHAYQPSQADSNRSMSIGDSLPSGTFGGESDFRQDPHAVYRAADARANLPAPYRGDDSTGYRSTLPAAQTPRSGYPPSGYPPTSYPRATYPVAGQSAAHDAAADAPSANGSISRYRPTDSSYGATTASRYGARPDARYREPGVARLQGGIDKPTESNAYDHHRSSLY